MDLRKGFIGVEITIWNCRGDFKEALIGKIVSSIIISFYLRIISYYFLCSVGVWKGGIASDFQDVFNNLLDDHDHDNSLGPACFIVKHLLALYGRFKCTFTCKN